MKYIFLILFLLPLISCQSTYIISKANVCHNYKFTSNEITMLKDSLNLLVSQEKYQLKNENHILKLKTKDKKLANKLEATVNHHSVVFRKITNVNEFDITKVYIPLSMNNKFKFVHENDKFSRQEYILGYVENEVDLVAVTQDLKSQGCVLAEEKLFWSSHSNYFDRKNSERRFLVATKIENQIEIPTTPEFLVDIKALVDYENFEPSIRLVLNECGWRTFDPILKNKDLGLNSVFIGDRFYATQNVRIRLENEICIFGFKTIEEAKAMADLLKNKTMHIRVEPSK